MNNNKKGWYKADGTFQLSAGIIKLLILYDLTCIYRRNCKGNPNCLVAIGEQAWLGEIDENTFHNIDDPNSERRDKVYLHFLSSFCHWSCVHLSDFFLR